tara:strand:+ start:29473 stop:30777 length:1305 start_codon:yes stop_codon:yes gene_type:complete
MKTAYQQHYLDEYQRVASKLPGKDIAWLTQLRQHAYDALEQQGLPHFRNEDWKYTNTDSIHKHGFSLVDAHNTDIDVAAYTIVDSYSVVFVNGHFAESLSNKPSNIAVNSLQQQLAKAPQALDSQFAQIDLTVPGYNALNTLLMSDGYIIDVPANTALDKPLHILHLTTDAHMHHNRNLVQLGQGASAIVLEQRVGLTDEKYFNTHLSQVFCDVNSQLTWYQLQQAGNKGHEISHLHITQQRDSQVSHFNCDLGGKLIRNDLHVTLAGENAECDLQGLYMTANKQHVDNHTSIHHAVPHCRSHEFYKGILADKSRAVFNGRVIVAVDAQKTDAVQTNNNLLLSDDAEIDTKPQLEIYADDVKCAHGATVGQLDENALFYLQSRGIDKAMAYDILTYGFAEEILHNMPCKAMQALFDDALKSHLPQSQGVQELIA